MDISYSEEDRLFHIRQVLTAMAARRKLLNPNAMHVKEWSTTLKFSICNTVIINSPQNYRVNVVEISEKAKNLQKEFHPDKHYASQENLSTENYSSYINSAKSTLVDDLKRA